MLCHEDHALLGISPAIFGGRGHVRLIKPSNRGAGLGKRKVRSLGMFFRHHYEHRRLIISHGWLPMSLATSTNCQLSSWASKATFPIYSSEYQTLYPCSLGLQNALCSFLCHCCFILRESNWRDTEIRHERRHRSITFHW